MKKVLGLVFATALLWASGAQAFQLNMHTPTIHLNPQPLPPGAQMHYGSGGGAGKVMLHNGTHIPGAQMHYTSGGGAGKVMLHNGTHIPK